MKPFELLLLPALPLLPPLYNRVRHHLLRITQSASEPPQILDVGGRKSHYTIGVPAHVTITDLPRETQVQHQLNLGINDQIMKRTLERRSNVRRMLYDDMTCSKLPDGAFDCVVSVEVLEHVEEDDKFVHEVHRVLKPGGTFLMTTPNGDSVKNTNPDHKRHYRREQLRALLAEHFTDVTIDYAIRGGRFRTLGLRGWSVKHPLRTALSIAGNVINSVQSAKPSLKNQAHGTRHLIAVAIK